MKKNKKIRGPLTHLMKREQEHVQKRLALYRELERVGFRVEDDRFIANDYALFDGNLSGGDAADIKVLRDYFRGVISLTCVVAEVCRRNDERQG